MLHSLERFVAPCAALFLVSCVADRTAPTTVTVGADLASAYVHRGMVQNENEVLQVEGIVKIPAKRDGTLRLRTWGNMDLGNDTGDAWFPDGNAGSFSQIDINAFYDQAVGNGTISAGVVNYNLPNGIEFPFGERGATNEVVLAGAYALPDSLLALVPSLSVHYDFDEVDGFYVRAGLARTFGDPTGFSVDADVGLAWMDGEQAFWLYAFPEDESGLADLTARLTARYPIIEGTTLSAFIAYSTVIDDDYSDWIESLGIDPDQAYGGIGVRWFF
ncbi:MAG: hypothetical protein AAF726_05500 [Planctomycetota bacterium]